MVRFTPLPLYPRGKSPPYPYPLNRKVGPRAGLDAVEKRKILHCRKSKPGSRARSQSLYRLRYLGSPNIICAFSCYPQLLAMSAETRVSLNVKSLVFVVRFKPKLQMLRQILIAVIGVRLSIKNTAGVVCSPAAIVSVTAGRHLYRAQHNLSW
jgi:hypothetical protein